MSAENIYQPHVHIKGELLGEGRGHEGPAAVARLSITWGADDWVSDVDAAILKLTVLDPRPDFGITAASERNPIVVTRDPDYQVMFRGKVLEASSRPVKITSPASGKVTRTYAHDLVCDDQLGGLQRDRRRGPVYLNREGEDHVAHWGPCTMGERKRDLQARTYSPILFGSSPLDQYDHLETGFVYTYPVVPYERQQVVSTLTVLRNTVRIGRPLARPYYDPATDSIIPVQPPQAAGGFRLIRLTGRYEFWTETDGQIIDSATLAAADGVEISSTALEQISRVELKMRAERPNQLTTSANSLDGSRQRIEWVEQPRSFGIATDPESQMTVSFDTDHSWAYFDTEIAHTINLMSRLGSTYGLPRMPDLTYRFDRHEPAPAWALRWLNPAPPIDPATGESTVYHPLRSAGHEYATLGPFAVPGGAITYSDKRGWEATVHPAPVGYVPSLLTLADLDSGSGPSPRLDQCVGNATVADLQHVTQIW